MLMMMTIINSVTTTTTEKRTLSIATNDAYYEISFKFRQHVLQ